MDHGTAVAMTLDAVWRRNKCYMQNAQELDTLFEQYGGLQGWLADVTSGIVKLNLHENGVEKAEITDIAEHSVVHGRMDNNPILFTTEEVKEILTECFYSIYDIGSDDYFSVDDFYKVYVCACFYKSDVSEVDGIKAEDVDVFGMQFIVTSELEEGNLWLKNLTNDLAERETAEKLLREYGKHKKDELYRSVMDIIVRANRRFPGKYH